VKRKVTSHHLKVFKYNDKNGSGSCLIVDLLSDFVLS
jgi:hypothetical protein